MLRSLRMGNGRWRVEYERMSDQEKIKDVIHKFDKEITRINLKVYKDEITKEEAATKHLKLEDKLLSSIMFITGYFSVTGSEGRA